MSEISDASTIRTLAEGYYRAMVAGDEAALRALFDPRAIIVGNFEGTFLWLDLQAFIDEAKGLVGQAENLRIDGDVGTVAVRGRYMGMWFVDHLSAVRAGSDWKIVSKTFHVEDAAVSAN
jgi:hypothetical protein